MIVNQYNMESNKLVWIPEGNFQSKPGLELITWDSLFYTLG